MNEGKLQELVNIMKALRAPDGCPWDKVQTHKTLKKCSMEECAELMDAIEEENDPGICEELGDLLMHIVFHSVIAEEQGAFTLDDVIQGICAKMIRRHPHVFGEAKAKDASDVVKLWESVKKQEHKDDRKSLMDGIPYHCPALLQAEKMQKKAAKVGFDWSSQQQILAKIEEELNEVREAMSAQEEDHVDEELGDLLFAVTNLVRFRKRASAEELLAAANRKFAKRFRYVESALEEKGKTLEGSCLEEMDSLWNEAKKKGIR